MSAPHGSGHCASSTHAHDTAIQSVPSIACCCITRNCSALCCTALQGGRLHCTPTVCMALRCFYNRLHCTSQHCFALHGSAMRSSKYKHISSCHAHSAIWSLRLGLVAYLCHTDIRIRSPCASGLHDLLNLSDKQIRDRMFIRRVSYIKHHLLSSQRKAAASSILEASPTPVVNVTKIAASSVQLEQQAQDEHDVILRVKWAIHCGVRRRSSFHKLPRIMCGAVT